MNNSVSSKDGKYSVKVVADAPSKADLLGYSSYVNALHKIITSPNTVTPFNIGVLGEWGTGKSTLMMQLASKLNDDGYPVVVFNPWKYDGKEELLFALIQTILFSFQKQESKEDIKDLSIGIAKGLSKMVLSKLLATATNDTIDLNKLVEVYTDIKEENIKFINQFESIFTELVDKYSADKRLIIFIDDLDRCLPDSIIRVLESIKLFLSVPKTIFIIGIDSLVIQEAIAERYGKSYKLSGKDYLEKIVQLSFALPVPSEKNIEEYTNRISGGIHEINIVKLISAGSKNNPRKIKRFINSYNFIKAIFDEEKNVGLRNVNLNNEILAFILILQIQFTDLYDYYSNNLKDCVDLLKKISVNENFSGEEIEKLLSYNASYSKLVAEPSFSQFLKKATVLGLNLELRDEGLNEYFSATKSISIESDNIENYYLPEFIKREGFNSYSKGSTYRFAKDLVMASTGPGKLAVVKLTKDITGFGLKESKDLVDSVTSDSPAVLLKDVVPEEQEKYRLMFEEAGATVYYR
ncbi:ribosomal protein L7/L12 [Spirosoma pulveris]